ncbi:acyl-CoA thioesterase [Gephyromycinifex aptenodytis]|uniref:acyl-CoA thioesterase n=1 Tax=Gephyromycinifex aptenodytis TaxID=2716227 RepID=UPI001445D603|nr:hotdog domain-containing protein [Gephyromycinifex aptenodytis]
MDAPLPMRFHSRKWVKPEDLNANGTLFGGSLLRWIDEEAAIYAILQLGNERCVTKYMSEINFVSSAWQGDLIELGLAPTRFGRTSLTLECRVRNMVTRSTIIEIEEIVMVGLDAEGAPMPHGYTTVTFERDRLPQRHAPIPRPPVSVRDLPSRPLNDLG